VKLTPVQQAPLKDRRYTLPLNGAAAVLVFACFGAGYFLSYALRAVNAAIAGPLIAEFQLNSEALGKLSSAYLLCFGLLQLPLGTWLDRYGPRRVEAVLLVIAALGCVLFAVAESFAWLWIGRALIGFGVSACLMAAFVGFRQWFAKEKQTQLALWMLVVGTAGVLSSTIPVQFAAQTIGWRAVFVIVAALLVCLAVLLWILLPRSNELSAHERRVASQGSGFFTGYQLIVSEPHFWRMALLGGILQGGFISLQSLWIGPWMSTVMGYSASRTAQWLFLYSATMLLGFLLWSVVLTPLQKRGWTVPQMAGAGNLLMVVFLFIVASPIGSTIPALWLVLAFASTCNTLVQTNVAMCFPASMSGRVNAWFNFVIFLCAFVIQWSFGALVDVLQQHSYTAVQSFRYTLLAFAVLSAVSWLIFAVWRAPLPQLAPIETRVRPQ
jgi:predicted MFS family arabinose efflux permease